MPIIVIDSIPVAIEVKTVKPAMSTMYSKNVNTLFFTNFFILAKLKYELNFRSVEKEAKPRFIINIAVIETRIEARTAEITKINLLVINILKT